MDPKAPNQFLMSSKRWRAAVAGVAILTGLTAPALGIPEAVLPLMLICATAIIVAVILGQTVTDVASGGRTSGSHPGGAPDRATVAVKIEGAEEAARTLEGAATAMEGAADRLAEAAEKAMAAKSAISGRAALLLPLVLAGALVGGTVSCAALSRYTHAEEKLAVLSAELQEVQATAAASEAERAAMAAQLERAEAARVAATQAAQEAAQAAQQASDPEARAELERRAAEAALAAEAARDAALQAAADRDAAEKDAAAVRRELGELAGRVEAALEERHEAEGDVRGQANTAGAAADMFLPGAGGLTGSLALAAMSVAAAYARSKAMRA